MPIIGDVGDRLDLNVRRGSSFGPIEVELQNSDGTEVDITGCTFQSFIGRRELNSPKLMEMTVNIISLKPAKFTMELSDELTSTLACGNYHKDPNSLYKWGFEMIDSLGRTLPLFYGQISVWQNV